MGKTGRAGIVVGDHFTVAMEQSGWSAELDPLGANAGANLPPRPGR
jgi:hypothetical protein